MIRNPLACWNVKGKSHDRRFTSSVLFLSVQLSRLSSYLILNIIPELAQACCGARDSLRRWGALQKRIIIEYEYRGQKYPAPLILVPKWRQPQLNGTQEKQLSNVQGTWIDLTLSAQRSAVSSSFSTAFFSPINQYS